MTLNPVDQTAFRQRGAKWLAPESDGDAGGIFYTDGAGEMSISKVAVAETSNQYVVCAGDSSHNLSIKGLRDIGTGQVGLQFVTIKDAVEISRMRFLGDRIEFFPQEGGFSSAYSSTGLVTSLILRNDDDSSSLSSVELAMNLDRSDTSQSQQASAIRTIKDTDWNSAANRKTTIALYCRDNALKEIFAGASDGNVSLNGDLFRSGNGVIHNKSFTVSTVPAASSYTGGQIYVTNGAAGSPVLAFSDGTNWLRCDDLTAISSS